MDRTAISARGFASTRSARPRTLALVACACVALGAGLGQIGAGGGETPGAPGDAHATRLPAGAQDAVSEVLGATSPAYRLGPAGSGFAGANPTQGMHLDFARSGVLLSSGGTRVGVAVRGVGYGSHAQRASAATLSASGNRVVLARRGISEWYVNGPLGVEQGFTLARPPAGRVAARLTISMTVSGNAHATLAASGASVLFSRAGGPALRYGGLLATDAGGRALQSRLALHGRVLTISVDARGARFPLRIDPLFQQQSKLNFGAESEARFGFSVALSGDGSTALIGARDQGKLKGGAWVFVRSGSTWVQQGAELASGEEPEAGRCQGEGACPFGGSVALSANGSTALIGGAETFGHVGAAWVFTRAGSTWTQQGPPLQPADELGRANFGRSVALSGDGATALIGGPTDRSHGAAWVFTRAGSTWSEQSKVIGAGAEGATHFGRAVAISGDAGTVLIGGPGDAHGTGAAWGFTRAGSTWEPLGAKIVGGAESGAGRFGVSVALSGDGGTGVVGGDADNGAAGAAWVFTHPGSSWVQQGVKLTSTGALDRFGHSVAVSGSGDLALIGAFGANEKVGAAWIYTRSGVSWSRQEELTGAGAILRPAFGTSVALASDAQTALVGGYHDSIDAGATWVFQQPAMQPEPQPEPPPPPANPKGTSTTRIVPQTGVLSSTTVAIGPPVFRVSGNIVPLRGRVYVKLPGSSHFVLLTGLRQVPFGTIIDAVHGRVSLTTARRDGVLQTIVYYSGRFQISQTPAGQVIAKLAGGNFKICPRARERRHSARIASRRASRRHVVRKLWAEGHGSYSTRGNYATGAVLGTRWLTEDLCEGTLIRVATDKVRVTNLLTHRHRTVRAGHQYLVKLP